MKKLAIVLVAMTLVVGGGVSSAIAGPYFSVNAGAVWVSDADLSIDGYGKFAELSFDTGYGVNAALGNSYNSGFRSEVEFAYRTNDVDDGKVSVPEFDIYESGPVDGEMSSWAVMINGYYDFDTGSALKPFIGAGLGYANVDLELGSDSDDDGVFAYQFMAGLGFAISKEVSLDLQYRFFATDDPEFSKYGAAFEYEYMTHNVMAGLRFNF
jgi:opacity protein-like surface antigen